MNLAYNDYFVMLNKITSKTYKKYTFFIATPKN